MSNLVHFDIVANAAPEEIAKELGLQCLGITLSLYHECYGVVGTIFPNDRKLTLHNCPESIVERARACTIIRQIGQRSKSG